MSACMARADEIVHKQIKGRLLHNEILAKYTSWKVGGPAQHMFFPHDRNDLLNFLRNQQQTGAIFWMGLGSNLLIRDGGISGTVINTRGRLKQLQLCTDGSVMAEAGVPCAHVARFCCDKGLTGAEFLAGIPGTMGGALKMNAGAFGGETWGIVENVEMVNAKGEVAVYLPKEFTVTYRSVKGHEDEWFLATRLRLKAGDTIASQEQIRELLARRAQTQPTSQPSCGSVFKNPEHDYAARLIEASGLKGYCIGGACVSEKHANFIVNTGQASAADIEGLIEYVRSEVIHRQNINLYTEVRIVGNKEES